MARNAATIPLTAAGAVAVVLILALIFNPWIFWIGGRFTPTFTWHGYGKFERGSQPYSVYVDLSYSPSGSSSDGSSDLEGTALVCGVDGSIEPWRARLEVESVWLDTDGKRVTLNLSRPRGRYPDGVARFDNAELRGTWRNPRIVLEDKGDLAAFAGLPGAVKTEAPTVANLSYADRSEFDAQCQGRLPEVAEKVVF